MKLNSFYIKKSKVGITVNNKSKSKKDFDPVTNFDKAFEKYIRSLINKKLQIVINMNGEASVFINRNRS